MTEATANARLNRALIRLHRGLLQYVGECWPWTMSGDENEQREVDALVRQQQESVRQLVTLLSERNWPIDFGVYPEFSEYHYVTLDYLLELLIRDEQAILAELDGIGRQVPAADADVVESLAQSERLILRKLQSLASRPKPAMKG